MMFIVADAFKNSDNVVFFCASNNAAATFIRENQIPCFIRE